MLAIGASIGGLVTAIAGRNVAFEINAASFFASAIFIRRTQYTPAANLSPRSAGLAALTGFTDLVEGFRYVRHQSHVAALICGRPPPGPYPFESRKRDLLPILRSVVSGELDADRMDYLQRDSFFTGVNYGKFDADWIVQNLEGVQREGRVHLALQHRAVFAFEDFLLSRYHMFLSLAARTTSPSSHSPSSRSSPSPLRSRAIGRRLRSIESAGRRVRCRSWWARRSASRAFCGC